VLVDTSTLLRTLQPLHPRREIARAAIKSLTTQGKTLQICCYCLSRIRAKVGSMKIEHWHCQDNHANEQLDYSNLLGACIGNEGWLGRDQHCHTRKGNRELTRNPANKLRRVEDLIAFAGDGTIFSHDQGFNDELNNVLNLNVAFLRNNRKAALTALTDFLRRKSGEVGRERWETLLRHWNGESVSGELQPYCQVVVYWLRKKLARH
jgi:uncharacterized protein (TIGR02646 family)